MQSSWKLLFILEICLAAISNCSAKSVNVEAPSSAPHTHSVDFPFKYDSGWLGWKAKHTKSYESDIHELEKYVTWVSNSALIDAHNALRSSFGYTLAMNQFGDLTTSDYYYGTKCLYQYNYGGSQNSSATEADQDNLFNMKLFEWPKGLSSSSLPSEVDWRTMGAVGDVKDQGRCKSCYAFSVTGAIEGMEALASGRFVSLSEQNIIDCSVIYGNMGCSGGSREISFLYVIDKNGINTEDSYPYIESQYLCYFKESAIGGRATGMVRIASKSETDLMAAVAISGPVTVGVDHMHSSFQFYSSGIFDEPSCSSTSLTHAMVIVGYGSYNGKDYWLVKNSWGSNWGMSGYIMMVRGKYNQCGIATRAIYPSK